MNYILYGSQYPMIKKRLKKILLERHGSEDDFNIVRFEYKEENVDEIIYETEMLPLGYDSKAVVVDNASFLESKGSKEINEKFLNAMKNCSESIDIILILRNDNIAKKSELFEYVKDNGQIFEFLNLTDEEWPRYVRKYFSDRNVEIEPVAINELVSRIDGDLMRFINEAEKLCLYSDHIRVSDIALMVAKPLEDDAIQIVYALLRNDNATALAAYRDIKLISSRATDPLIPLLASQFRFISQVMFLSSKGLDKSEIASQLNASEGRVGASLRNAKRFSRRQIAHALDDLYYLDYQIKSGQIDRFYGLELFLINFPN